MSMPEFPKPDPDFTQEQALTMILSSIALEEAALSHIMNAEGEKIQYILKQTDCHDESSLKDILSVNKSVANLLEIVLQNQMILKNKMERVLEFLPKPPCRPDPPAPPKPPCCEQTKCCSFKSNCCFGVIPNSYHFNQALQWYEKSVCGCFGLVPGDCSQIQANRAGRFAVDLYLDTRNSMCSPGEVTLTICFEDKHPIVKTLYFGRHTKNCFSHERIMIELPCSCYPCRISASTGSLCGIQVRQGGIVFTKL